MLQAYVERVRKILPEGQFVEPCVLFCRGQSVKLGLLLQLSKMFGGIVMTSMKGAPVPTFNSTINQLLVKSVRDACAAFEMKVTDETPVVRRTMFINGDYLAGIRVSGASFQGTVSLSMDKRLAKLFADKIFADAPAKTNDAMLCDLVGEVCNQITGQIQRALGQLGCKMQVSAQETTQSEAGLDLGASPDEWLLVPFKFKDGSGVLSFGFTGELGIGNDEVQEDLNDTRKITFF